MKNEQEENAKQEELLSKFWDSSSRFLQASDSFERCLATEGSPAMKDVGGSFLKSLEEVLNSATELFQEKSK